MKKLALTLAIILGIALGASAQNGGLFGKGPSRDMDYEYGTREGGLIQERYAKVSVGVSVFEHWFMKRKYK